MLTYLRPLTTFALTAALLTFAAGGCSQIGEAIDCDQMCEQLQTCVDGDLDVRRCADRCEDRAENDNFAEELDRCTDCLDRNYSCAEIPDECAACQDVADALL